jgi:glycosyltransferase involved in cell wall biosynthesis
MNQPKVTVIIVAYNDERVLMKKLELPLNTNLDFLMGNSKRRAYEKLSARAFLQVICKFIDFLLN